MKIIFSNPENVYLHGTDAPGLFSADVRDFSHGCIRVQNPADLVAWVLRNNPGWDLERVKATMNGEKNNLQVNLATRIPVLIVYGTATVNEENQIRFSTISMVMTQTLIKPWTPVISKPGRPLKQGTRKPHLI